MIRIASFVGIGLLPVRLRTDFNFSWDEQREKRLLWLARQSRRLRAALPTILCVWPQAPRGERRFRRLARKNQTARE